MTRERRQYDKQFKQEAVRLTAGKSVPEVARDLGIKAKLLYQWRRQLATNGGNAFPGHGRLKPHYEQLRKLQRELASVTEERDILKKALAIFSKPRR